MDIGLPVEFDPREACDVDAVTSHDMANAIRILALRAAGASTSNCSDVALAMADVATVLWSRFLKFDPTKPNWSDRDRFVLSAGQDPALLDALLCLTGHQGMTADELTCSHNRGSISNKRPTSGHAADIKMMVPRFGQDLANAVGIALAERIMSHQHGADLVDHDTFMFAGQACLTRELGREAASLAGRLKLGRLIVFLDDHEASPDEADSDAYSDDILKSFEASGWGVSRIDGHDHEAIGRAIEKAKAEPRPSLIACRTEIDRAVSAEPTVAAKRAWRSAVDRGKSARESWEARLMGKDELITRAKFGLAQAGGLFDGWRTALDNHCRKLVEEPAASTGHEAARAALGILTQSASNVIGITADAAGSNMMISPAPAGDLRDQDIRFDGNEDVMMAVMNGIALHGGLLPYGRILQGFSSVARNAIRQSALLSLRVVYVLAPNSAKSGEQETRDSLREELASLRAIPNLDVMCPADAVEMAECWALALRRREGPSILIQSDEPMPAVRKMSSQDICSERGAYVLAEASSRSRALTLLATGAGVSIALAAREALETMGVSTAVVSMPCFERFNQQPRDYQASVLGAAPRLVIEAANLSSWAQYVASDEDVIHISTDDGGEAVLTAASREDFGIVAGTLVEHVVDQIDRRLTAA